MSKSIVKLFVACLMISFTSCGGDDDVSNVVCTGNAPTYKTEISAIMNSSCARAGCHDATSKSGGYDLSTYTTTVAATKSAKFLPSIKHEAGASKMPQGSDKLTDAEIKSIECWISNGKPE